MTTIVRAATELAVGEGKDGQSGVQQMTDVAKVLRLSDSSCLHPSRLANPTLEVSLAPSSHTDLRLGSLTVAAIGAVLSTRWEDDRMDIAAEVHSVGFDLGFCLPHCVQDRYTVWPTVYCMSRC